MPEPVSTDPANITVARRRALGHRLLAAAPFALVLCGLWLVLSPQRDLFHVGLGGTTAIVIAWVSAGLVAQTPPVGGVSLAAVLRLLAYLTWLAWQVVVASVRVARIVLDPRLPVDPTLTEIRVVYPSTLAKLTLANSITLTPGTVTLDVNGDDFLVHSLTRDAGRELEDGAMSNRVSTVFGAVSAADEGGS